MNAAPKTLRTLSDLGEAGLTTDEQRAALERVAAQYAVAITPVMSELIDRNEANDPIAKQFVPDTAELRITPEESPDPIGDLFRSTVHAIPCLPSSAAAVPASVAELARMPWSTIKAVALPPRARVQASVKTASAMLSAPPEHATAISGLSSKGPTAAINSANSVFEIRWAGRSAGFRKRNPYLTAAQARHIGSCAIEDALVRTGKCFHQFRICRARGLVLTNLGQGFRQFEEIVRGLVTLWKTLIGIEENTRRFGILLAHIIGFAHPVHGIASERVVRMAIDKGPECVLRLIVVARFQFSEGIFILLTSSALR